MRLLYTLGIRAYGLGIKLAAILNPKAKKWVSGRKTNLPALTSDRPPIWFHCASTGEYEQGRPVIEALKQTAPERPVLLTFFSPSGYEMKKSDPVADAVVYLPLDTPARMRDFIAHYRPAAAVFVKYEIWHNCLAELRRQKIATFLISAKFRGDQVYFKPWGRWFLRSLHTFRTIFTQDEKSASLLKKAGIGNAVTAGDTRFDRVAEIAEKGLPVDKAAQFKGNALLFIAGSTWPADEALIAAWWKEAGAKNLGLKLLLVPHEVSPQHTEQLRLRFPGARTFDESFDETARVLIMNKMGYLSRAYRYADLAYVGGGFGAGIHNLSEAAVFGCPVLFGPNHRKFDEARGLIEAGGGFEVRDGKTFKTAADLLLTSRDARKEAAEASRRYTAKRQGATERIAREVTKVI